MTEANDEKMIDWQMSLKFANNKEPFARELLTMLIDDLPKFKANILKTAADRNIPELHQHCHKLHSTAFYCGVKKIKDITQTLESLTFDEDNFAEVEKLIPQLMDYIDRTLAEWETIS